jgi:hypothetical protein
MVEIAPLIAASLLTQRGKNEQFFSDYLVPRLRQVLAETIPDITGQSTDIIDVDTYVEAMVGIHLTIALEHLLANKPIDPPFVAKQVTAMFASGVARTSRKTSTPKSAPKAAATAARRKTPAG